MLILVLAMMLASLIYALVIVDQVSKQRVHERCAEHALELARQAQHDSPERKVMLTLARYHAHRAGYRNGFQESELDSVFGKRR